MLLENHACTFRGLIDMPSEKTQSQLSTRMLYLHGALINNTWLYMFIFGSLHAD